MERYAKRYINMKASHPEIAKRMPHEALNVILNTLDAYIANHKDVFDVLDKAAYKDSLDLYRRSSVDISTSLPMILGYFMPNCFYCSAISAIFISNSCNPDLKISEKEKISLNFADF